MEKIQTLLLILVGLGVFVWKMVQKARAALNLQQQQRPTTTGPPVPATSFQELLRQMQAQNAAGQVQAASETATVPRREAKARKAANPEPARRALRPAEQPTEIRRTTPAPIRVQESARPNPLPARVAGMLRTPADVRAAFVLSEILKPKF